ncbi:DUF4157 domain-containing protein [Amycolatopsis sp. WGS_07]|uniref:eCIS core domain-containing protein n=1 Tax=Amycolatopsis sp. WGS_07 TaxID=3076764 RepID=UPI003873C625
MSARLGQDFSTVRVHADSRAAESARALGARAYTIGSHIAFGAGQYAPATASGQQLLAHELTHVVQQHGLSGAPEAISRPSDPAEQEARTIAAGSRGLPAQATGPMVHRDSPDEEPRDASLPGGAPLPADAGAPATNTGVPAPVQDAGPPTQDAAAPTGPVAPELGAGVTIDAATSAALCARFGTQIGFVLHFRDQAIEVQRSSGVPAAFILGQMALELGWTARGATGNNLFNVEAGPNDPPDRRHTVVTTEVFPTRHENDPRLTGPEPRIWPNESGSGFRHRMRRDFRTYPAEADAIAEHSTRLTQPRFAAAWQHVDNPAEFARLVATARPPYATDPRYPTDLPSTTSLANRLAALIRDYPDAAQQAADHADQQRQQARRAQHR